MAFDINKRFLEEVKLRAYDDRYIDVDEEKEIIQIAIENGVGVDAARNGLRQVCENNNYVIESALNEAAKDILQQFAENDGVVDKREFDDAVGIVKKKAQGKLNESQCRKKVKQIVQDNDWKVREGFMKGGKWFSEI